MKKLLALPCLIACAAAFAAGAPEAKRFAVALEAKQMHEECARLEAGEQRAYSWKSDAPLDFNIHYHHHPEVFYPVKREAMRGDGGTFIAKTAEDYCWMWTARDKPAKLDGRIEAK